MSTQKITSGSVTYFVCECGNPPQYCKCSELARIAHLEQQAARLANLPALPEVLNDFKGDAYVVTRTDGRSFVVNDDFPLIQVPSHELAEFFATLLNTCYPPAPGQQIT